MIDIRAALLTAPVARWLGVSAGEDDIYHLQFNERHIGNPTIRAIHGGVVEAFLEVSAQCALAEASNADAVPQIVNADIDYLRSTRAEDMHARARVTRLGRRIAFVEALAWQHDEKLPVAIARFRIRTAS